MLSGDLDKLRGLHGVKDWRKLPVIRADDPLVFHDGVTLPVAGSGVRCLICTRPFQLGPYVGAVDALCPECAKTYADTVAIACTRCRQIIMRVAPRTLGNGFVMRPRTRLHVSGCPGCMPHMKEAFGSSPILEAVAWEKERRERKIILPAAAYPAYQKKPPPTVVRRVD